MEDRRRRGRRKWEPGMGLQGVELEEIEGKDEEEKSEKYKRELK